MLMDEKMDHGPIFSPKIVPIAPNDTYPRLSDKLAKEAQILLLKPFGVGKEQSNPQTQDASPGDLLS